MLLVLHGCSSTQSTFAGRTKCTSVLKSSPDGRTIGGSNQDDHGSGFENDGVK